MSRIFLYLFICIVIIIWISSFCEGFDVESYNKGLEIDYKMLLDL